MKIFFFGNKNFKLLSFKTLSRSLLIFLFSCLVITQIGTLHFESASQVSSPEISPGHGQVIIFSSPLEKEDIVYVYIDGEKHSKLEDNKAQIIIDKDSTIEIMSETDKKFTVNLSGGDNIEFVGGIENIECKRGINYICRCIVD